MVTFLNTLNIFVPIQQHCLVNMIFTWISAIVLLIFSKKKGSKEKTKKIFLRVNTTLTIPGCEKPAIQKPCSHRETQDKAVLFTDHTCYLVSCYWRRICHMITKESLTSCLSLHQKVNKCPRAGSLSNYKSLIVAIQGD